MTEVKHLEVPTGKRFNLMRYFVLASLVTVVGVAVLTAFAFGTLMRRALIQEAERDAVTIAKLMAAEFETELEAMKEEGMEIVWMDPRVQNRLSEAFIRSGGALGIIKIKAFDEQGQIIYSTDPSLIGKVDSHNPDLQAALDGRVSSMLVRAEEVADLSGEVFVVDVIETYVPVAGMDSALRTFEIYQDATGIQEQVRSAQLLVVVLVGVISLFLFVVLLLIVRRADQIITRQTTELETAYVELRRLEQLKADLTHMIVHDMKNPLTSIGGYADLVARAGTLTSTQERFLERIRQNSQRLLSMINNMLDIGRLEEGKLELHREVVPVHEIVDPPVAEIAPLLEEGGKTLHLDIPPDLPPLWVDRNLLIRVMGNLLSNAEKHTEQGGNVWITARLGAKADTVEIGVRDDGEGIPAEYHDTIFEKFGQAGSRRLGRKTDTGLGLAFCKLTVEAHGGTIGLESEVGRGSTFTVTLPVATG